MKQIKFIFILIILMIFFKFNAGYEKHHDGESVLEKKGVKKTLDVFSLTDAIIRFVSNLFIFI
jgi:hypothetical protein